VATLMHSLSEPSGKEAPSAEEAFSASISFALLCILTSLNQSIRAEDL
jgi:hypothetical protein